MPCASAVLPAPERTDQHDEVARPEQLGQGDAQVVRVGRRREDVVALHRSVPATAVRSASSPARGAPFGPNRMAADG